MVLKNAGINSDIFKAHSVGGASTTAAVNSNRELKQRTFLIHLRLPEVKFQASRLLRMPSRFWDEVTDGKVSWLPSVVFAMASLCKNNL